MAPPRQTSKRPSHDGGGESRSRRPALRQAPPRRGGFGWFIMAALVGGILAVYIFAPDLPNSIFGPPGTPSRLGDEPVVTKDQKGEVSGGRAVAIAPRPTGPDVQLAAAPKKEEPKPELDKPAEPERPLFPDAKKGQDILAKAEEAYSNYRWGEAERLAGSMLGLDIDPATSLRAKDIVAGAKKLEDLFDKLGTKDELVRNLETHPALLEVTIKGKRNLVVPVTDFASKTPVETDDAVGWLKAKLGTGEAAVLFTNGIAAKIKSGDVSTIEPGPAEATKTERRTLFDLKLAQFQRDPDLRNDPLAWYEAAKYAYRNRLDGQVVNMLDRALLLEPDLGMAIREDTAREWFTKLIVAMDANSKAGADGYMVQLRKYQDTAVFVEAEAYYSGNMAAARKAREDAAAARRAKVEQAREKRIERAKAKGDEQAVEQIQQEAKEEEEIAAAREEKRSSGGGGDLGKANGLYDEGLAIYQQAQSLGATSERDQLYDKAKKFFTEALDIYAAAVEAGDTSVEARMTQCAQLRYACIKYKRAF